jgi:hypothetical protein
MYVYIKSEPNLWTVGFYDPDGKFQPESDHDKTEDAARRVSFLNGKNEDMGKSNFKSLEVLDIIIADCETDVKEFDGKPFTGKTLGQLHGIMEAKIQAIAKIVKKEIE